MQVLQQHVNAKLHCMDGVLEQITLQIQQL